MTNIPRLILASLLSFATVACSIQVSGVHNTYQPPKHTANVAALQVNTTNATLVAIDGKATNDTSVVLTPGLHQLTLYVGKNNYTSTFNRIIVLQANFKPNTSYFVKASGNNAWIDNASGKKVSSVISKMKVEKSVRL